VHKIADQIAVSS